MPVARQTRPRPIDAATGLRPPVPSANRHADPPPLRAEPRRASRRLAVLEPGALASARPFLKWAGGKTQLLPALQRFYPETFRSYHEPFAGSAAVFFDLHRLGRLEGRRTALSDTNRDVIGCYQAVVRDCRGVIDRLRRLASRHASGGAAFYYEVRDRRFNPLRLDGREAEARPGSDYPAALAAMLIYLNRTGFNGLYRLNGRGWFNVPAGRYANPRVCDADNLRRVAAALDATGADLRVEAFDGVAGRARAGDFIYFDPPYAPLSPTAGFTAYTAGGFTADDQRRLCDLAIVLARRGCHVLLSNSAAALVRELYVDNSRARAAGLRPWGVQARRAINSRGTARGPVLELVITNVAPRPTADPRGILQEIG